MKTEAVELFYEELGQGKSVIFLHGFPLDHTTWLPVAHLMQTKVRCILPDLRGLGRSPLMGIETGIPQMASDVIRLMDRLDIRQAVVVGHSMGGYVAMQMAHSFPDRVSGLGLAATRTEPDTPEKSAERLASRQDVLANGPDALISTMAARLTDKPDILRQIMAVMRRTSPQGIAMAQYAMAYREDATAWVRDIEYPVVVVAGGMDGISPLEGMKNLADSLQRGKFYSHPSATHMIPMEEPGLIARALEETYFM